MWRAALLCLLLPSAAFAQTQYGTAAKPGPAPHPQTGCPWLTEGSAAHTLGGDISAIVKVAEGQGTCTFTRKQTPMDLLEISVSKAALHSCPSGSASLRGIGNEALTCRHGGAHGDMVEMVSSRVRDQNFTVTLTTRSQKNAGKADDPQNDALEQVAEQIAGSLY